MTPSWWCHHSGILKTHRQHRCEGNLQMSRRPVHSKPISQVVKMLFVSMRSGQKLLYWSVFISLSYCSYTVLCDARMHTNTAAWFGQWSSIVSPLSEHSREVDRGISEPHGIDFIPFILLWEHLGKTYNGICIAKLDDVCFIHVSML